MGNNARTVGLNLRRRVSELYNIVGQLKAASDQWVLDGADSALPSDGVMKTAIEVYESMSISPLRLFEEIKEIKSGTGEPLPELPMVPVNIALNWETVLNKPSTYPPAVHDHLAGHNVVSWQSGIYLRPETFPPDNHTHVVEWADVQNKQASYPPNEHSHNIAWGELTGIPPLMKIAEVAWTGNGAANRVIALPFVPSSGTLSSNKTACNGHIQTGPGNLIRIDASVASGAVSVSGLNMTLVLSDLNTTNYYYHLVLRGVI